MKKEWTKEEFELLKNNLNSKNLTELSVLLNRTEYSIIYKLRTNNLKLIVYKEKYYNKNNYKVYTYNWIEIQKYYDDNKTWRNVKDNFNITDLIILQAVNNGLFKTKTPSESIKLSHKLKPRKLSEETKKKISISRIKYLKENPSQVPYLLNHYSKGPSYPEIYFDKLFTKYELKYDKFLQISIYQLDFAFVENGINIEIDGDQHYLDKRIVKSNIRKDIFLKEKGWEVIRIKWSDYQKMIKEEKYEYIKKLIEHIKDKTIEIPIIVDKKTYCNDCGKEVWKGSNRCSICDKIKQRKVKDRPSIEQLLIDIKEFGYLGTGRKYGVSDNCIRKWIK